MDDQRLFQPLLPTTTTTTTTITCLNDNNVDNIELVSLNSGIIFRLLLILSIGILSIWANHEASKGFKITTINDAKDSPAGQRFALLYISNGKATRTILNASKFVEKLLYPDNLYPKKQVNHVTLRVTSRNLTHVVIVNSGKKSEFVMHISPSIMEEANVNYAMASAVQRGMSRVWLWDGGPPSLLDGMVEYISLSGGFGRRVSDSGNAKLQESDYTCWEDKDPVVVAHFLNYCEGYKKGFIQRLNQAMQHRWHDRTVDDALGLPAQHLCDSFNSPKDQL